MTPVALIEETRRLLLLDHDVLGAGCNHGDDLIAIDIVVDGALSPGENA
jgi:hypothetical protein